MQAVLLPDRPGDDAGRKRDQRTGGLDCVTPSCAVAPLNTTLRIQSGMTEPCARSTTGTATSKRLRKGSTTGNACRRSIAPPVASQPVGAIAWRIAVSACWIASFVGRPWHADHGHGFRVERPQPDPTIAPRGGDEVAVHAWQGDADPPSVHRLLGLHEGTRGAQSRAAAVLAVHVVAQTPKCGGAGSVGLALDAGLQRPAGERPADLHGSMTGDDQFVGGLAGAKQQPVGVQQPSHLRAEPGDQIAHRSTGRAARTAHCVCRCHIGMPCDMCADEVSADSAQSVCQSHSPGQTGRETSSCRAGESQGPGDSRRTGRACRRRWPIAHINSMVLRTVGGRDPKLEKIGFQAPGAWRSPVGGASGRGCGVKPRAHPTIYISSIHPGSGLDIDFILATPLVHANAAVRTRLAWNYGVWHGNDRYRIWRGAGARPGFGPHSYSPGDFLRQFGAVIAVCLGLALLAQALVTIVGVY